MNNKRKLEIKTQLRDGDDRYKLVKPANLKSNVWHNFDLIQFDGKLEDYACCKKCKDVLAYSTKTGTGSLIRHNCDNQNSRRKTSTNHTKQQNAKKDKSSAAKRLTFDPLDYVQSGTTTEDLYAVQNLYEQSSVGGVDSKKRSYGEAFDDTSSASVQQGSNPDPDDNENDYVYGEYVDMGYLIKPEPNQVGDSVDIDDDMNDDADDDDDDQSPVNDVHCNEEDVTTPNFNLLELLMQSNEGQNALSYYDLHNHLNLKYREVVFNTLINIINSSSECQKYNENLRRISYELRQLFPMENYTTLELHKYTMRLEMGETPQEEDLKLYNLLNSWSLQHLYDHFRAENITFELIKYMGTQHMDRLFKNLTIGDSILFELHFKKWLENDSPEPLIDEKLKPLRKVLSITSTCPSSADNISLLEIILKSSSNGQHIKQFYQQNRLFNKALRSMLINVIARYFETNSICLTTELNNKLEMEIIKMFPTEKIEFYKTQNRSRIYAKVYNKRRRAWKQLQILSANEKLMDTGGQQQVVKTVEPIETKITKTTTNGCYGDLQKKERIY